MNLVPEDWNEKSVTPMTNVIPMNEEAEKHLEILKKDHGRKAACPGMHRDIVVDEVTRTVQCSTCGFTVDAFDYLNDWAKEGARKMEKLKHISTLVKISQAEHDDLERRIKNMRATLKRGGHPQPDEEHMAYKMAIWNPNSPKTKELLDRKMAE